ncbi:MAG: hypothetical protein AB1627_01125 [Chloroflexota bacterium]
MEILESIQSVASAPAIVLVLLIVLLVVATKLGWVELKLPGGFGAKRGDNRLSDPQARLEAARIDLQQYGEVTAALEALLRARPDEVEAAARHWFSELATRLATRLKEERHHHYRVAIWLDDPQHRDRFVGVGHGLFNKDDTDMDFLERRYTIGGLAFDSPNMYYYCRDRRTDPQFKPRKSIPPSFESVFGLALGTINNRWGVMTVDARQANGFPEETQWLIWRFGELASLGAVVWELRAAPPLPGPSSQRA